MTTPNIEFALLVRITDTVERVAGDGARILAALLAPGYDFSTLYGRISYASATTFTVDLYSDYERDTLYKTATRAYVGLPGTVSLGGGWFLSCANFGPLAEGDFIDFTYFAGNDPQVGLRSGCFAWITGTPGYDGSVSLSRYNLATKTVVAGAPTNPNTAAAVTIWQEGMIVAGGLGVPNTEVEFSDGGAYGVMSGAEINLANAWPTQVSPGGLMQTVTSFLQERGLSFIRAEVTTYIVIDNVFYPWSYLYGENSQFGETEYTAPLADPHAFIHGDTPHGTLTKETFKSLPAENNGKPMPLVVGKTMAKLVQLADVSTGGTLGQLGTTKIVAVTATAWNSATKTLTLRTPGINPPFTANDPRLIGQNGVPKYLSVLIPGTTGDLAGFEYYAPRIASNLATALDGTTTITLYDLFLRDDTTGTTSKLVANDPVVAPGTANNATWWFKILEVLNFAAVSEGPINAFIESPPRVYNWSTAFQSFVRQFGRILKTYVSGGYPPYPTPSGMLLWPSSKLVRGEVIIGANALDLSQATGSPNTQATTSYAIGGATFTSMTANYPGANQPANALIDRNSATWYRYAWTLSVPVTSGPLHKKGWTLGINGNIPGPYPPPSDDSQQLCSIDLPLPVGFVLPDGERLFVAVNWNTLMNWPVDTISVVAGVQGFIRGCLVTPLSNDGDFLRGPVIEVVPSVAVSNGEAKFFNPISPEYTGGTPGPWEPVEIDPEASESCAKIYEYLRNPDFVAGCKIRIRFFPRMSVSINDNAAEDPVNIQRLEINEVALFSKSTETQNALFTKVTGVNFGTGWGTRTPARGASDPILRPGDFMEYLIRVQDQKPAFVDTASFDAFASFRDLPAWFIGTQMEADKKNNFERLQDLAKTTFACIVPGKDGARQVRLIDRYQDPSAHPEVLQIFQDVIDGSMGNAEISPLDRLFTSVDLKYDKNPATGDFNNRFQTLNEDQETFPLISAMVPASDPPIPLWTTWVTGMNAYDLNGNVVYSGAAYTSNYSAAKTLWEKGRASYLRVGQKRPYTLELETLRQRKDWFTGVVSSTEDAAYSLALFVADYLFVAWRFQPLSVPITTATATLNIMDRVGYGDPVRTDGRLYYALVKAMGLDTIGLKFNLVVAHRVTDQEFGFIDREVIVPEILQDVLPEEEVGEFDDVNESDIVWRDK